MSKYRSTLGTRAFGELADPRLVVACESHQEAMRFLSSSLAQPNGIALLQGPPGSGKSTIVREQADWMAREAAVALVEGQWDAHVAQGRQNPPGVRQVVLRLQVAPGYPA